MRDPDLERILARARTLAQEDAAQANLYVRMHTNGEYQNPQDLAARLNSLTDNDRRIMDRRAAQQRGPEDALSRTNDRAGPFDHIGVGGFTVGGLRDFGVAASHGATFGLSDEIAGAVQGAGSAIGARLQGGSGADARAAFREGYTETRDDRRQHLEDLQELNPVATGVAEAAGGVATGAAAARGILRAGEKGVGMLRGVLGRPAPRGHQAAQNIPHEPLRGLQGMLRGSSSRTAPLRQGARVLGVGAGAGAGGGAAYDFGSTEGSFGERVSEAARIGPRAADAFLGAGVSSILGGPGVFFGRHGAMSRTKNAGQTLADDARHISGGARQPSAVRAVAEQKEAEAQTIFRKLELENDVMPESIDRLIRNNPTINREFRKLDGVPEAVRNGDRPVSFTTAQDIARNLKSEADHYARGANTAARSDRVRNASTAFEDLDRAMGEALDGYPEAQRLWAEANIELRTLSQARKMVTETADDVEDFMRRLPQEVGTPRGLTRAEARAYHEEIQKIAQEGMLHEQIARWTAQKGGRFRPAAAVRETLNAGDEHRRLLRQVFPDDESFNEFIALARNEETAMLLSDRLQVLITAGAFLGAGTSVFGKLFTN